MGEPGTLAIETEGLAWVFGWSAVLVAVFAPLTMRLHNSER